MRLIIFCFVASILICILFVLVFFCCYCCFDAKLLIKFMSFRYPSELRFESLNKHSEEQVLERTEVGKQIKFTCKSEKKEKSRSKEAAALGGY